VIYLLGARTPEAVRDEVRDLASRLMETAQRLMSLPRPAH